MRWNRRVANLGTRAGFTGTGKGMSERQKEQFLQKLVELQPSEFHHGDCVGADMEAHGIAASLSIPIHIHPPTDPKGRAFCEGDESYEEAPYLDRNHDIVDSVDVLIAVPKSSNEVLRSGTWATIRYARKMGKPVFILER